MSSVILGTLDNPANPEAFRAPVNLLIPKSISNDTRSLHSGNKIFPKKLKPCSLRSFFGYLSKLQMNCCVCRLQSSRKTSGSEARSLARELPGFSFCSQHIYSELSALHGVDMPPRSVVKLE